MEETTCPETVTEAWETRWTTARMAGLYRNARTSG